MRLHKKKYFVQMVPSFDFQNNNTYMWYVKTNSGRIILHSKLSGYKNKAQCRNVGKKFASYVGLEWRE